MPNCNMLISMNKILGTIMLRGFYGVILPLQEADDPLEGSPTHRAGPMKNASRR
jgi:hypothetical protein